MSFCLNFIFFLQNHPFQRPAIHALLRLAVPTPSVATSTALRPVHVPPVIRELLPIVVPSVSLIPSARATVPASAKSVGILVPALVV